MGNRIVNLLSILLGIILKCFFNNDKIEDLSIIGSSSGKGFSDNGKHLFIHYYKLNKKVFFVTKSLKLYKELKKTYGANIKFNYSLSGIRIILRAKYYFFTHNVADIYFVHNNKTNIICLFHGMPIKKIGFDYNGKGLRKNKLISKLFIKYVVGFKSNDINLIVSTSYFFNDFLKSAWKNDKIKIMTYPRINYLKDILKNTNHTPCNILYMPTHRDYGFGRLNPLVFYEDLEFQGFLHKNSLKLIYRLHPNMLNKLLINEKYSKQENKFDLNTDSQDALYNASILISDYSSCIFDYLECEKPIVFYHYDNYEKDDNKLYYSIQSLELGPIANTELELKIIIKKIIEDENYKQVLIKNIKSKKNKYLALNTGWTDYEMFV